MPSLKQNVIANYIGGTWTILIGIAFVPVYIHFLGVEAYGLIGLYVSLQAWITIFDFGLTPTLNREMAKFSAHEHDTVGIYDTLRTLETIYAAIFILVIGATLLLAPIIASQWLQPEAIKTTTLNNAIILMAIAIGFRGFMSLYRGAIMGLQEQVWLNKVAVLFSTTRGLGVIPVIALLSPKIELFFVFQSLLAALELFVVSRKVYRLLPKPESKPQFRAHSLNKVKEFAGGVLLINICGTVITQADKLLISYLLPLKFLGYYSLASSVCSAIIALATPVANSAYPRFTELVSTGDFELLRATYRKSTQLVATIAIPAGAVLIIFSEQILTLWTQQADIAAQSSLIVSLYAMGATLNGVAILPYMLQLAFGHTRLMVIINCLCIAIFLPLTYFAIIKLGAIGGTVIYFFSNVVYVTVGVFAMHRKFLTKELSHWYQHSFLMTSCVCLIWCFMFYKFSPFQSGPGNLSLIFTLLFAGLGSFFVASLSTPFGRNKLNELMQHRVGKA